MIFFRKKAEKHTADKKKNVTLETFDGDILLSERLDRRILPDVPDPTGQRASFDRRGVVDDPNDVDAVMKKRKSGIRYKSKFPVTVDFRDQDGKAHTLKGESRDISETGILVRMEKEDAAQLKEASETDYWLELLFRKKKLTEERYVFLKNSCGMIRRKLIASITISKTNSGRHD